MCTTETLWIFCVHTSEHYFTKINQPLDEVHYGTKANQTAVDKASEEALCSQRAIRGKQIIFSFNWKRRACFRITSFYKSSKLCLLHILTYIDNIIYYCKNDECVMVLVALFMLFLTGLVAHYDLLLDHYFYIISGIT